MDHKLFSSQVKTLSTVDVRFDKRGDTAILNQECIDKYQENAYLLGRIFALEQLQADGAQASEGGASVAEVPNAAAEEDEGDNDDDYELGELINEIVASTFSEKDTDVDMAMAAGADDDEEVAELAGYLTELQAEFRAQKTRHEKELSRIRDDRNAYLEMIQKVKLRGYKDDKETYE